jgi:hypothetical protein
MPADVSCSGGKIPKIRVCAGKAMNQSDAQLSAKLSGQQMQQWRQATKALCVAVAAPYKGGSIQPQLETSCIDGLNRAALKVFGPWANSASTPPSAIVGSWTTPS